LLKTFYVQNNIQPAKIYFDPLGEGVAKSR